jgi:rhodanese-related sulfurtransferase
MTIIDVREPEEFSRGHVKGAINIPASELWPNNKTLHGIPKDEELILYCVSGSRSNVAIGILKTLGYTNLTNGINKYHVEAKLKDV